MEADSPMVDGMKFLKPLPSSGVHASMPADCYYQHEVGLDGELFTTNIWQ